MRVAGARRSRRSVPIFAALGDETRVGLVDRLSAGGRFSITSLAEGTTVTRQAVTKHLRVLESAGLVRSAKDGRERVYALSPEPLDEARAYLERVSASWDRALARLKAFVEEDREAGE